MLNTTTVMITILTATTTAFFVIRMMIFMGAVNINSKKKTNNDNIKDGQYINQPVSRTRPLQHMKSCVGNVKATAACKKESPQKRWMQSAAPASQ